MQHKKVTPAYSKCTCNFSTDIQWPGITTLGFPTALNAKITAGNVRVRSQPTGTAPFHVQLVQIPVNAPARPTQMLFRSRKYCNACSFKRSEHIVADEGVAGTWLPVVVLWKMLTGKIPMATMALE